MDDEKGLLSDDEVTKEQSNDGDYVDIYGDLGEDECRNVCKPSKPWEGLTGAGPSNEKHQENVIDDDVDIYGDLKSFEDHLAVEELETKVDNLEQKCASLDKENKEMKSELEKVNKINAQLKRNISSIFKTARAELERKEKQLKDLQSRYDSLVFRRNAGVKNTQPAASAQVPSVSNYIKKEPNIGNLIELNDQTECIVKMGSVTIGFASDHYDFQKTRLEMLKTAIEQEKARGNENIPAKQQTSARPPAPPSPLEDGEAADDVTPAKKPENAPQHRSRTRSTSPPAKRRRSPPRRQQPPPRDREPRDRSRRSRSPPRSKHSRYGSRERHRSNPRSHAR